MDCSSLLQNIQSHEYSNLTNDTTTEIWLDRDETLIFDAEYSWNHSLFWVGMLITVGISIIGSYILSYHYYPYIDKKQKLLKLKILNIGPYLQDTITPYLQPNTQYNKDIDGIIFDYANIDNISVNSILDSNIEFRSAYKDLCTFILISSLLTASYLQFYWVISHWADSYRSYVETECYYYYDKPANLYNFQVNINKLCDNYVSSFYIYDYYEYYDYSDVDNRDVTTNIDYNQYDDVKPCYVHKDRFTVRASTNKGVCNCCTRCGKCIHATTCCCGRDCCCCLNVCGYCVCIITALESLIWCVYCIKMKIESDTHDQYQIKQRAMDASSNEDKEYLLTIQENSGEIY